ncbi:MAG: hypothetical protein Q9176_000339 [Flavoplaca citrina]
MQSKPPSKTVVTASFRLRNLEPATGAEYLAFMYPRSKAGIIISLSTYGLSYEVKKSGVAENQVASRIPRLSQLSDALWESWIQVEKANPGHLRYYGVDTVQNE